MAKKEILNNDALTMRVNEEVLETAEKALDVIEDKLDVIEQGIGNVVTVTKNNPFLLAGALIMGVSLGAFVGYKFAQKRLERQYEERLVEEIAAAKEFHQRMAKRGEYESPESAVEALIPEEVVEAVQSYQGRGKPVPYDKIGPSEESKVAAVEVKETTIKANVFADRAPDPRDWDYDREIALRAEKPDEPYVISFEEFNENEPQHEQVTITYFALDDTLADERQQPIDNTDYTVGDDNLTRFGHGSADKNVVYVRNEKIDMDFEIIRSEGSYKKDVLGFDEDEKTLRHAQRRSASRRGRGTDE